MSINHTSISRRDFLKQSTLGMISMGLFIHQKNLSIAPLNISDSMLKLGRILKPTSCIYDYPSFNSKKLDELPFNSVINLKNAADGEANQYKNTQWFLLQAGGYIHAGEVQLVENKSNQVVSKINRRGQLAQLTVPFTQVRLVDRNGHHYNTIFYYGSTHWIESITNGADGETYYRIREDRWGDACFIKAEHLHLLDEMELLPISPNVNPENKQIKVDIKNQMLYAYEGVTLVFSSPMSSGVMSEDKNLYTPSGDFEINYKRPSRHMAHGDRTGYDNGDLYGVPWVSYFTSSGIAFHGTYWHNDFGFARSHGCVNLPIQAAYWIYLWSLPTVPPLEKKYVSLRGTQVTVL